MTEDRDDRFREPKEPTGTGEPIAHCVGVTAPPDPKRGAKSRRRGGSTCRALEVAGPRLGEPTREGAGGAARGARGASVSAVGYARRRGVGRVEAQEPGALMGWVERVQVGWERPEHLAGLVRVLEAAPRGSVRGLCGVAVRHWKSSTVLAAIAKWLLDDATLRVILMTHSMGRAQEMGKDVRDACRRVGVRIAEGRDTICDWRTTAGGGVSCMSAQQSKLGADVDILVWDDPIESPQDADDARIRQTIDETIAHYTSRLSRGGSCIGVMSRFHPDDPIGRRLRRTRETWEYVHAPAVVDEGLATEHALNPAVRTLEELAQIRDALREQDPSERLWWSQWQGEPRAPSGDLFKEPTRYATLPLWPGWRTFYGIDLAFTTGRLSDYAAIVAVRSWGSKAYVLLAEQFKLELGLIARRLSEVTKTYGRGPIFTYASGPEVGIVQEMARRGLPIQAMPARFNKLVRCEKTVTRWNHGDVCVPTDGHWVDQFLEQMSAYRGVEGDSDDLVDALVSGLDGGLFSSDQRPRLVGQPSI